MDCPACGATLRPNARFCNFCGVSLANAAAPKAATEAPTDSVSVPGTPDEGGASDSRVKRPPRVPRSAEATVTVAPESDDQPVLTGLLPESSDSSSSRSPSREQEPENAESAHDAVSLPEPVAPETAIPHAVTSEPETTAEDAKTATTSDATAEPETATTSDATAEPETATTSDATAEPETAIPHAVTSEPEAAAPVTDTPESLDAATHTDVDGGADASGAAAATDTQPESMSDWEAAETLEYRALAAAAPARMAAMPSLDQLASTSGENTLPESTETAGAPADALPWPLPLSIIVGGRYRVEAIMHAAPDGADAENIYRVSDLQGYERCWSCSAEYGVTGASDRFCRECGADMLGREFVMHERRSAPVATAGEEEPPAAEEAPGAANPSGIEAATPSDTEAVTEVRVFTQGFRTYRVAPRVSEPPAFPLGVRVVAAAATDVGATRTGDRNEDSLGVFVLNMAHDSHMQPLTLCVVADGLGGHANGQEASRLVVRTLTEHVMRTVALPLLGLPVDGAPPDDGLERVLRESVVAANTALCAANAEASADMGSTVVAVLIAGETAYIANVGDSRAYLLDGTEFRRVTTDHSLVEQLVAGGLIEPDDRYSHPQRNQIFRSLGDDPLVQVDTFTQRLRPTMRLLLCSDGLWEMVRDDECAGILLEVAGPQEACDALVRTANTNGGEDNISAIVIDVSA